MQWQCGVAKKRNGESMKYQIWREGVRNGEKQRK